MVASSVVVVEVVMVMMIAQLTLLSSYCVPGINLSVYEMYKTSLNLQWAFEIDTVSSI